jgi:peptide/nickel transport system permease protein
MRVADAFLAFPALVLAIAITGVLGVGLYTSMISVGVVFAPIIARLTFAGVQEVRDREYVLSARVAGCKSRTILLRHVLPHALGPVIVQTTILSGLAFIIQAALAFLGLSVQPPAASWGADLAAAYQFILVSPREVLPPGILIALVVLSVYRVGDAVRDRFAEAGGRSRSESYADAILA